MEKKQLNDKELADQFKQDVEKLKAEIGKVIIGQKEVVNNVLNAIFCNGHMLLVGVPGLAKTLLIKTISDSLDLSFSRVQFTPDLMPSDIVGSEIIDESRSFKFVKGPIFANIVLADEINRTPPKTQAALLEAMQEKHVSIAGTTYQLPKPFFVLATQNPIEQEGTYPLPEAQLDRFMYNTLLDYPSIEEEMQIVKNTTSDKIFTPKQVLNAQQIMEYQALVRRVVVPDNVYEYIVKLVASTRPGKPNAKDIVNEYISFGAGPRASQNLILGAKCHALMNGKYSPDIEDVKVMLKPVLSHRLLANYKAAAEGISIDKIIEAVT